MYVRVLLFYIYNVALIAAKRTAKIKENVDGIKVVPRAVMVTSTHDNHMTPVPLLLVGTSLLRQKN
jgi:hypothetical protein